VVVWCADCTGPLLDPVDGSPVSGTTTSDQRVAAGWDALTWAERIAPDTTVLEDLQVPGDRRLGHPEPSRP
jgi:hypothetical protein